MPGNGIVLCEPSVIAYDGKPESRRVKAVGKSAAAMEGRASDRINVIRPVEDGVIANADACRDMLTAFLLKVVRPGLFGPKIRAVVGIPVGLSLEERRVYDDVFAKAGCTYVTMVENAMLSAIGAGLPVHTHKSSLIVDIGGGMTEIAVISLASIVSGCAINVGGDMMDKALRDFIMGKYDFGVGTETIKRIKSRIGSRQILGLFVKSGNLAIGRQSLLAKSANVRFRSRHSLVKSTNLLRLRGDLAFHPVDIAFGVALKRV